MTGIIEGVVSRVLAAEVTTNTTEELRATGFGVPKFAVIDLMIRSTATDLNTADANIKTGYGNTRVFVGGSFLGSAELSLANPGANNSSTSVGLTGFSSVTVRGMDVTESDVLIDLVDGGVDVTFGGTDISSGAAIGYCTVRMYTGRGILNAVATNQSSNSGTSPSLPFQPNALLAMTANYSFSGTYSFGGCDHNLNQASYGIAHLASNDKYGTVSSNTKALHSVTYNGGFREEISFAVTAFTTTGWTNTVSVEPYALTTTVCVLAIELEDPTEFEIDLATDTNSLSTTVELSAPYSNMNWDTVRSCTVNVLGEVSGTTMAGLSSVSNSGTNSGWSWAGEAGDPLWSQIKGPTAGASVYVINGEVTKNTWTSTANAAGTKVSYALTAGTAVSESCVYLSWGFVKTPRYNILVGEEYPRLSLVGSTYFSEAYVGEDPITNYI
jgi:hypothetical protein